MLGKKLRDRYHIIKLLGQGGFGVTYLAQDYDLPGNPYCVVKHLKPKTSDSFILDIARRLFNTEAKVLYELGKLHDCIPSLSAHFEENGEFYFVQDFINGHELSKELIPGKKLSEVYAISLLKNVLEILVVAHNKGVIHRDINPKNLMRRQDGKIVLIDFGAVKEIGSLVVNPQGQTNLTIAIGTLGYMPSEQAKGKPKLCSDIYALGMVAIQALTGKEPKNLPEDQNTGEIIWRNHAHISRSLANIIDKMVRDHFSQRYQDAEETLQAILDLSLNSSAKYNVSTIFLRPPEKLPEPANTPFKTVEFKTVKVNLTGRIIHREPVTTKVFIENIGQGVTIETIEISGGTFIMGSPNTEVGRYHYEGPQHKVTIAPFYLGKYQVTQEQWEAIMGNNPSHFQGAKRPVEQVSWDDAVEFCQKLSEQTGKRYRLPSEAEWEYACRAGTDTPFYFGETITSDLVNYNGNYSYGAAPKGIWRKETTDVGSFPPNAFGLYDMHGNVWEWCTDPWHDNYRGAPSDGKVWDETHNDHRYEDYNLLVNIKNDLRSRMLRGGSWLCNPDGCRAAFRDLSLAPDVRYVNLGFRVAWTP
jgi:formylglycine-generating enzyme required for sulfatase activity/tRNA A-37 threonylcarbamoyl transferase component Bud32